MVIAAPLPLFRIRMMLLPVLFGVFLLGCASALNAEEKGVCSFVEFRFVLPACGGNPFAREIDALVDLPGERRLRIPAFSLDGRDLWAVRVRVDREGVYRLVALEEPERGENRAPTLVPEGVLSAHCAPRPSHGFVRVAADDPRHFAFDDGTPYTPLGVNLAWVFDENYETPFAELERQHLNWSRLWMAHWGASNLEWTDKKRGPSPKPGTYDLGVARFWDATVASAERHGVYFQLVFQHHGQYSTEVNPSWEDNPWNARNGGFLERPSEFFSSPEARRLAKQKLRYSTARWGYSTSIMAWELFNEAMFTDAYRLDGQEQAVADWHAEMAAYLRKIDPYRHLVTTSLNELDSPVYKAMDYLQPHIYALDMVSAMRRIPGAEAIAKPAFYGEQGDDRVGTPEERAAAATLDYATWASLAGETIQPAQQWDGARLLATGRISALGAAARFAAFTRLFERRNFRPLAPTVLSAERVPARYEAAFFWEKRRPAQIPVTETGTAYSCLADIPYYLVGTERQVRDGFADRIGYLFDRDRETNAVLRFDDCGPAGARVEVLLDGVLTAEREWKPRDANSDAGQRPASIALVVPQGHRRLDVVNRGEDSVKLASLSLDYTFPALAAFGKKTEDFAVLFVWHRKGVHGLGGAFASGEILVDGLSDGRWTVTWWNIAEGAPGKTETLIADKGILRLATPPIDRYGMVALERQPGR